MAAVRTERLPPLGTESRRIRADHLKRGKDMFFKKYGDIVVGVFFMALSAILMFMAQQLPKSKVMDIGPEFMPMVIRE